MRGNAILRLQLSMAPLVAVLLAGSGCLWVEASNTVTRSASHLPGTHLDVLTQNGDVEVIRDETTTVVAVTAEVSCFAESAEEAQFRAAGAWVDLDRTEGVLQIRAGCDGLQHDLDGADIYVRLPGTDGVTVQSTNGDLRLEGLSGPLFARTTNGQVTLSDHVGEVEAQSTNGAIVAERIDGPARLATSNGHVSLSLVEGQAGPVNLVTTNGNVEATLGAAFFGRVEVGTSAGGIDWVDPTGRVIEEDIAFNAGYLVVDRDGQTSHLSTTNGNVDLDLTP